MMSSHMVAHSNLFAHHLLSLAVVAVFIQCIKYIIRLGVFHLLLYGMAWGGFSRISVGLRACSVEKNGGET